MAASVDARAGGHLVLAVAVLAGLGGCDDDRCAGGNVRVLRSPHFEYSYCEGDPEVCPGIVDELERHLSVITTTLAIDPARMAVPIRYVKRPHDDRYRGAFHPDGVQIDMAVAFHEHELVHAYTVPQWGRAPNLLAEGIAEALGCSWLSYELGPQDWRTWLNFDPGYPGWEIAYPASGRFVSYLLSTYGVARLRQLYTSVQAGVSPEAFAQRFAEVYQTPVDEAWRAGLASPMVCVPVWACSAERAPTGSFQLGATCHGPGERLLEQAGDSGVVARVRGRGFRPLRCEPPYALGTSSWSLLVGGLDDDLTAFDAPESDSWVDLPAGTYALTHYNRKPIAAASEVTLRRPPGPWVGGDGDAGQVIELAADRPTYLVLGNARSGWAVRLRSARASVKFDIIGSIPAPREFALCRDGSSTDCKTVSLDEDLLLDEVTVLQAGPRIPDGYTTYLFRPHL
jgi:hypothetical protein